MTWYAWAVVGLLALASAVVVLYIGKPRKPTTPASALIAVILNGLMIWAVVALAERAA